MNKVQVDANGLFAKLAMEARKPDRVARFGFDQAQEADIWKDVLNKLGISSSLEGKSFLDVGCGCGSLAELCLDSAAALQLKLCLVDIPEVIETLKKENAVKIAKAEVELFAGVYPDTLPKSFKEDRKFDFVLLYSVIHYTSEPLRLIEAAIEALNPEGTLLIGDIPNIDKRARFRASRAGREFDAKYNNVSLEQIPEYADQHEYLKKSASDDGRFNDSLIASVFTKYRYLGYDVFVLPQPLGLARSRSREDLLIHRHD